MEIDPTAAISGASLLTAALGALALNASKFTQLFKRDSLDGTFAKQQQDMLGEMRKLFDEQIQSVKASASADITSVKADNAALKAENVTLQIQVTDMQKTINDCQLKLTKMTQLVSLLEGIVMQSGFDVQEKTKALIEKLSEELK